MKYDVRTPLISLFAVALRHCLQLSDIGFESLFLGFITAFNGAAIFQRFLEFDDAKIAFIGIAPVDNYAWENQLAIQPFGIAQMPVVFTIDTQSFIQTVISRFNKFHEIASEAMHQTSFARVDIIRQQISVFLIHLAERRKNVGPQSFPIHLFAV